MTFSQFLSIFKARWISALIVLSLTVGSIVAASLLMSKQYTATAAIVADFKSPDPIIGMALGGAAPSGYLATQVDIIQSNRVAQLVVRDLKLTENTSLRADWQKSTGGNGDFESWVADLLQAKLTVKPSRDSNVINIAYTSPDPKFAAAMANAFVKAYLDTSIELRVDPARQYNAFFDARGKELRGALEVAQTKLSDYQRVHGIIATDERLDVENQRLNELTSQLVAIQAVSAESQSRSNQANTRADQLQDVINNPVVSGLRADLSRQEAKLEEFNARFGPAHPQVLELKANIAELQNKLNAETRRVSGSVGINNSINKVRESEIRSSLEAQRNKILRMKEQRDEAAVLLRDVETAQRSYDSVTQRQNQAALESQSTQTNISVLTNATVPSGPSSPRVGLNSAIGVVLGLLLAVGFVVLREFTDRRVRRAEDLTELLGTVVLGQLPKPISSNASRKGHLVLPNNILGRLPSPGR